MTFSDLEISFVYHGLHHTIKVPSDYDSINNLPYDLASAFEEVMEKTEVNPEIVIEELMERFGYQQNKGEKE